MGFNSTQMGSQLSANPELTKQCMRAGEFVRWRPLLANRWSYDMAIDGKEWVMIGSRKQPGKRKPQVTESQGPEEGTKGFIVATLIIAFSRVGMPESVSQLIQ